MIISIASGKGGTGKTTIAINLALSLGSNLNPDRSISNKDLVDNRIQFLDCDVEEPNAHIFLKPYITQKQSISIPVPKVDKKKCTYCGRCQEVCVYNAIAVINPVRREFIKNEMSQSSGKTSNGVKNKVLIFPELCHGCGGCSLLCPEEAIEEIGKEIGIIQIGKVETIDFVNGKLNIGEAMSPPLIRAVRKNITKDKVVIIDAPPGTSCPVIESIKGSDYCVLVTEPTPFGLSDLILAVEIVRKLKILFGIVINRADIGDKEVSNYCSKENIPILMEIPFDRKIAESYSTGIPMVEAIPEYRKKFIQLFKNIKER